MYVAAVWHTGRPLGLKIMDGDNQIAISERNIGFECCLFPAEIEKEKNYDVYIKNSSFNGESAFKYIAYRIS